MPSLSQQDRLIRLQTPLGPDVLVPISFAGREAISRPFSFALELVSETPGIAARDLLGKKAAVSLELPDGGLRHFHGHVTKFAQIPSRGTYHRYRMEAAPWLWFLTRVTDCRIFQFKSIPQIIEQIFAGHGFQDFRKNLIENYSPLDYFVWYRESAFNCVSRAAEGAGIFYFFEHEQSKHTLVLADNKGAHNPCPGKSEFEMVPGLGRGAAIPGDVITSWERHYSFQTAKLSYNEFDYKQPKTNLMTVANGLIDLPHQLEVYDYPGLYNERPLGETLAKIRMEEEEADYDTISGRGTCRHMAAGHLFTLTRHERQDQKGDYLLTSVTHLARQGSLYGDDIEGEKSYANTFSAIPAAVPYRPPRVTPRPVVEGLQTAVVTGPQGEEIYSNEHGCVKVQFPWDRYGKSDENSSCWIRVNQPWAGKNWGGIMIPRIGQEVVVDHEEGDPDRPVIVGRVYNAVEQVPYEHPTHQTRSSIMSRSSKGGASGNFNEIRFEDKKGAEQVFLHGEKDLDLRVTNDYRLFAGNEHHRIVGVDEFTRADGNLHQETTGNEAAKIGGNVSLDVTGKLDLKAGGALAVEAGREMHLSAGTTAVLEAGATLTVKVGGNHVTIDPSGVTIMGTMVKINAGGSAASVKKPSPQAPQAPREADKSEGGETVSWKGGEQPSQSVGGSVTLPPAPPPPPAPAGSECLCNASNSGSPFISSGGEGDPLNDAAGGEEE